MNEIPPPARIPRTTIRWLMGCVASLTALLAALLVGPLPSGATNPTAGNRVGVHAVALGDLVEPSQRETAGQQLGNKPAHRQIVVATGVAANAGAHVLPSPQVGSTKLQNIVSNLYKGTTNPNRVGNGTTMDAIRNELATGVPTGGRMHITKGQESLRGLENRLSSNPNAPYNDRLVAQSLADELRGVLPR